MKKIILTCLVGVLILGFSQGQAQAIYRITDLGDLPGGSNFSNAYDINDHGQVVGISSVDSNITPYHGFIWDSVNGITDLGDLPGGWDSSYAHGINNAGHAVGYSSGEHHMINTFPENYAFICEANNGMSDIGLNNNHYSMAFAINNNGIVAGRKGTSDGSSAFIRDYISQTTTTLGGLKDNGNSYSSASCINDHNQVAGFSEASTGTRAFYWDSNTGMIDLGDLFGGDDYSVANDINDNGQVIGVSDTYNGRQSFIWNASGGLTQLVGLGVDSATIAYGINNPGQIVGFSYSNNDQRAVVWEDTTVFDLNSLIDESGDNWVLTEAISINNFGQITGRGINPNGDIHAYLLTPVPEPVTLSLLFIGGVNVIRKRRS